MRPGMRSRMRGAQACGIGASRMAASRCAGGAGGDARLQALDEIAHGGLHRREQRIPAMRGWEPFNDEAILAAAKA